MSRVECATTPCDSSTSQLLRKAKQLKIQTRVNISIIILHKDVEKGKSNNITLRQDRQLFRLAYSSCKQIHVMQRASFVNITQVNWTTIE